MRTPLAGLGLVALAAFLALAAAFARHARADVDVPLRSGDKVAGTLRPASDRDTFRVVVPKDAVLTLTAKGLAKKGRPPVPAPVLTLKLLDPVDADLAAGLVATNGAARTLSGFVVP